MDGDFLHTCTKRKRKGKPKLKKKKTQDSKGTSQKSLSNGVRER
jgi:hypothetical protein